MKKIKYKNKILVSLVALFTMLMCVSVGFASWIVTSGSSALALGQIEADETQTISDSVECVTFSDDDLNLKLLYEESMNAWPGTKMTDVVINPSAASEDQLSYPRIQVDTRYYKNAIFTDGGSNVSSEISLEDIESNSLLSYQGAVNTTYVPNNATKNGVIYIFFNKPNGWGDDVYCYLFNPIPTPVSSAIGLTNEEDQFGVSGGVIEGNAQLSVVNTKLVYPSVSNTHSFTLTLLLSAYQNENAYSLSEKISASDISITGFSTCSSGSITNSNTISKTFIISNLDISLSSIDFSYHLDLTVSSSAIKSFYREIIKNPIDFKIAISVGEI